ncbi:MAG: hypothetical protein HON94_15320 [Methylococcales bacterium]|jgi:uncharacterized protein|nr:hypothetical protein [Methylococcales bacterium]MBT7409152.1 hypothetical protein [Methylococcales bacterium]
MKLTQIIHSFINPRRLSENADFLQNKAKSGEKAQFTGVNEHFEPNFNVVLAERCVFGQPPRWQISRNLLKRPLIIGLIVLSGCTTGSLFKSYPEQIRPLIDQINQPKTTSSFALPLTGADKLLRHMEAARIAQIQQNHSESLRQFNNAIEIFKTQEQQAVIRLSEAGRQGNALLINDNALPYQGDSYEKILVHTFQAMNYLFQKDLEGAAVEIRRINSIQKQALSNHEKELDKAKQKSKNSLLSQSVNQSSLSDSFLQIDEQTSTLKNSLVNGYAYYLSGLIYELRKEWNDAYIDYKKALELNPGNHYLQADVKRLGYKTGLSKSFPTNNYLNKPQLIILYEQGLVAKKREISLPFYTFSGDLLAISFPTYRSLNHAPYKLKLYLNQQSKQSKMVSNINLLAAKSLQEKRLSMIIRQIGRAVTKHQITKNSEQHAGAIGGFISTVYNIISERADLRSWLTLPSTTQIIRTFIEPEKQTIRLKSQYSNLTKNIQINAETQHMIIIKVIDTGRQIYLQKVGF